VAVGVVFHYRQKLAVPAYVRADSPDVRGEGVDVDVYPVLPEVAVAHAAPAFRLDASLGPRGLHAQAAARTPFALRAHGR
jgi:hypothetical protein